MERTADLIAASTTPIVLAILAEADSYGYHIIKRVREASGGRVEWTDGMLYPVLHRLERLGHVESRWEVVASGRRRKFYAITARGRAQRRERGAQPHANQGRGRDGGAMMWRVPPVAYRLRAA